MSDQMQQNKIAHTISDDDQSPCRGLLQLPDTTLDLVLQQLNRKSLASTAMTCSKLRNAAPATIRELDARCPTESAFRSFRLWLRRHRSSLASIKKCSITGSEDFEPILRSLPCPGLIELDLQSVEAQLGPVDGSPGVLHYCRGLTSLRLDFYYIADADAAAAGAAIAALPQLKQLNLAYRSPCCKKEALFAVTQLPSQLTHLSLDCSDMSDDHGPWQYANWSQLSVLVNLGHLELTCVPFDGIPGGIPSQLAKLTCLTVKFDGSPENAAEQFQHLSSLTALQQLAVDGRYHLAADYLSGIGELSQLTSLTLESVGMQLRTTNTYSWACLPALENLALKYCVVQPDALQAFTKLRSLSLDYVQYLQGSSLTHLLGAVAKLSLLTELVMKPRIVEPLAADAAAAFTALTSSTNLVTLKVGMPLKEAPEGFSVFKSGAVYPHLRVLDLRYAHNLGGAPISEQQLQYTCSSCPNAELLAMAWNGDPSPTAWLPVQQLTALTLFAVSGIGAAAPAVVSAAAQLRKLQWLNLAESSELTDAVLLQLTALTALTKLLLPRVEDEHRSLHNKAPSGHLPDVAHEISLDRIPAGLVMHTGLHWET